MVTQDLLWGVESLFLSDPACLSLLILVLPLLMECPTGIWENSGRPMPSSLVVSTPYLFFDKFLPLSTLLQFKNLASCFVHSIYSKQVIPPSLQCLLYI